MEIGEILNELKDDPIYVESIGNGIDVEKTVLENMEKWKKYKSVKTVVTFAKSELNKKIQSKSDTTVSGIAVGQCDVFGTKIPVSFPLLVPDGNHISLVHYDVNRLPEPARVELKVRFNSKYNNYQITDLLKFEPLDKKTIVSRLLRVARGPADLSVSHLQKGQVLVIRGVIGWVNPARTFENGAVTGNNPVYLPAGDTHQRYTPVMDINLEKGGENTVVFQLGRQKYGKPIYDIDDMTAICQNAVAETPDSIEQAKIVKNGLTGRTVVAVGEITFIKIGDKGNFINMKTFAMYEYSASMLEAQTAVGGQMKLEDDSQRDKPTPPISESPTTSEPKENSQPVEEPPKQDTSEKKSSFVANADAKTNLVREYGEKIRGLADVLSRSAGSFSASELRSPLKVPDEIPDVVIEEAISYAMVPSK